MEIRQLRYFTRAFETGSITRAASELSIVQSALSLQLSRLEDELKVSLLVRSAKGIAPTAAGQVFYQYALGILRQVEQARSVAKLKILEPLRVMGSVTLGLAPTTASAMGLALLKSFREKQPTINLNIVESRNDDLAKMLLARKIDIAVLFSSAMPTDIDCIALVEERFFFVEKRRGASVIKGRITLKKVVNLPLILPSRTRQLRRQIDDAFAQRKLTPNIMAEIDSIHTLLGAVTDGMAFSIQPWSAISHVQQGLALTELSDSDLVRHNYLCSVASDLLTPTISSARDLLLNEMFALVSGWTRKST
jgi:LysR family tcuABC transcriptional regulator